MSTVMLSVGTNKGGFILKSDESRSDWSVEGPFLEGWDIRDTCLDTRGDTPTLWAAVNHFVFGGSIQRSTDLGTTWDQIENGPKYADDAPGKLETLWSIVPGRDSEPGVLYAGVAEAGLFVSRDNGDSWQEVEGLTKHESRPNWGPGAGGLCCHTIVLDPDNDQRMWVGISAAGCFRTEDGGATWTRAVDGLKNLLEAQIEEDVGYCVHRIVLDPTNTNRLFQQYHFGVYKSENGGDTWETIENGLPRGSEGCFGFPIVMDPHNPDTLYIVPQISGMYRYAHDGKLAVYKTTDAGANWKPCTNGLPDNCYQGALRQAMAVDTLPSSGVYMGTTGGKIYASTNGGDSWTDLPGHFPRIQSINAHVLD